MPQKLEELKMRLFEINDLNMAAAVLSWDQLTYMPPGGAPARGRQMSTLARLAHDKFTDPAIGRLLDDLRAYEESQPYDSDDAALIRVTRREYERATRIPSTFVAEMAAHQSELYSLWEQARPQNDFARVRDGLEKTLDLSRRLAEFFAPYEHIADPLIDFSDYGIKAAFFAHTV